MGPSLLRFDNDLQYPETFDHDQVKIRILAVVQEPEMFIGNLCMTTLDKIDATYYLNIERALAEVIIQRKEQADFDKQLNPDSAQEKRKRKNQKKKQKKNDKKSKIINSNEKGSANKSVTSSSTLEHTISQFETKTLDPRLQDIEF